MDDWRPNRQVGKYSLSEARVATCMKMQFWTSPTLDLRKRNKTPNPSKFKSWFLRKEAMALRGAVATACNVGGRHRNPSLLSIPHHLNFKFHYPPSHALHRFTAFPIYQPGGESLSLFSIFIFQSLLGSFSLYRNNKKQFSLKAKFWRNYKVIMVGNWCGPSFQ